MSGIAYKLTTQAIETPQEVVQGGDFNTCLFSTHYKEIVFGNASSLDHSPSGRDWLKNDSSSFLFPLFTVNDEYVFKLFKDDKEIGAIESGMIYGEYWEFENQVGFRLDWGLILKEHNTGIYKIQITKNVFGVEEIDFSREFLCVPYDQERANKTIRIEVTQTGNIFKSPLDYSKTLSTGWYSSLRVRGRFGLKTPEIKQENFLTGNYRNEQRKAVIINKYTLSIREVPENILDLWTQDGITGNEILITDYNLFNTSMFQRVPVIATKVSQIQHFEVRQIVNGSFEVQDRSTDNIKRNY